MRHLTCGVMLLVTAAMIGCGDGRPKRVLVSGIVLIDGKPLEKGVVKFVPQNARASRGVIGKDGRFVMSCYEGGDGIVPGTHQVAVISNEQAGPDAMRWFVPLKYADCKTSGIEYTINEDRPDLTIELEWGGGKPFLVGRTSSRSDDRVEE